MFEAPFPFATLAALAGAAPEAGASAAPPGAGATVTETRRPDPGLARGVWEAPPWAFVVAIAAVAVVATAYALGRAGLLRRRSRP